MALKHCNNPIGDRSSHIEQEADESRQTEERIRRAAEEWRTMFDSIEDPVSIHDRDFRIIRVNKAFAAAFRMEAKELIGKKCYEIIHSTAEPSPACPHRQILQSGKTATEEFFEPRLRRFLQISISPILNERKEIVWSVHVVKDITEHKRVEEALQKAHDELQARVRERTTELAAANERLVASEKDLEERLKFETMLSEISAGFVNLPVEQIDNKIWQAQQRVSDFLGFDCSTLWQVPRDESEVMLLTHIHQPPGMRSPPRMMDARTSYPWSTRKILSGETLVISKMADLPPEADCDRETWHAHGTRSTLVIPLSTGGGKVIGALSFALMREERNWQEPIVKRLRLVGELFANALGRKHADLVLLEAEEHLRLATNAADAGLWIMELDKGRVWVTAKTRELFQLSPDEAVDCESFFRAIHPLDRMKIRQDMQNALDSAEDFRSEYRILLPAGDSRWLVSRGRGYLKSDGEPSRLMGVSRDITERKKMEDQLKQRIEEIERLKEQLYRENIYLQREIKLLEEHSDIIGQSLAMKKVLVQAEQVAQTDSTVLILGETGTGKELLARAIHRMSGRKEKLLVSVNCASLPPTLIESELFGREKGAYTGALTKMVGRFEIADRSTLFLDEVAEIPFELQGKLLRVLEQGEFERLGSTKSLHVDIRIIAATNRDIGREVQEGRFRKDLFYRLNVFPIVIPPLRERPEDIPLMVWAFIKEFRKKMGKKIENISKKKMEMLRSYSWPGNVRELRNVIERGMIASSDEMLVVELPLPPPPETLAVGDLEEMERRHITSVLEKRSWRVGGKGGASEVLGLKRSTLYSKMKKLNIRRPNA